MAEAVDDPPPVVADPFLGGRLLLRQPAEGHRCGTDAVHFAVPQYAGGDPRLPARI